MQLTNNNTMSALKNVPELFIFYVQSYIDIMMRSKTNTQNHFNAHADFIVNVQKKLQAKEHKTQNIAKNRSYTHHTPLFSNSNNKI